MKKEQRAGAYLTRESYRQYTYHFFDKRKNLGFDWRPVLLKRSLSTYLLSDNKRLAMVEQVQRLLVAMMDQASRIKKAMNIYTDKNEKYYN
jgi:hypothetical protein